MIAHRPLSAPASGFTLIEMMVAVVIGLLLLLGLSQMFLASRNSYRLQEGLSRIQENTRLIDTYLEENVRMAGYMGCGNDIDLTTKPGSPPAYLNHLVQKTSAVGAVFVPGNPPNPLRFDRPVEGYNYSGGSINGVEPPVGAAGDWSPAVPADLGVLTDAVKGSDILVLRFLSEDSTAVTGAFSPIGTFTVVDPNFVKAKTIYALTNCAARADIFEATTTGAAVGAGVGRNPLTLTADTSSTWLGINTQMLYSQLAATTLNAEVHRARYAAIYVGKRAAAEGSPVPVLKVAILDATQGGAATSVQELADNVEVMQVLYGVDTDGDGNVDAYQDANTVLGSATTEAQKTVAWRRVLAVRVGLLMRSPERAAVPTSGGPATYKVLDASVSRPADGYYRSTHEITVALRNRLANY